MISTAKAAQKWAMELSGGIDRIEQMSDISESNSFDVNTDIYSDHRSLIGLTSAAHSTVTGNGTVSIEALKSYTVTVTAKDSSGNDRNVGGDKFYIRISNECTNNSGFSCTEVGGAEQTIPNEIFLLMTDNTDGTYTYSYQVQNDGKLVINVILGNEGNIHVDYYYGFSFNGAHTEFYLSYINHNFGEGPIYGRGSNSISCI